jgi:hypothetical protein
MGLMIPCAVISDCPAYVPRERQAMMKNRNIGSMLRRDALAAALLDLMSIHH